MEVVGARGTVEDLRRVMRRRVGVEERSLSTCLLSWFDKGIVRSEGRRCEREGGREESIEGAGCGRRERKKGKSGGGRI